MVFRKVPGANLFPLALLGAKLAGVDLVSPQRRDVISQLLLFSVFLSTLMLLMLKQALSRSAADTRRLTTKGPNGAQKTQTVAEHDAEEYSSQQLKALAAYGVASLLFWQMKMGPPALLQAFQVPCQLFASPLFQILVWGAKEDEPGFSRPWKQQSKMEKWVEELQAKKKAEDERAAKLTKGLVIKQKTVTDVDKLD
jgi:hypothetical protein